MLWAQFSGALAVVAALREVSVVFAAIIGVLIFHEPAGNERSGAYSWPQGAYCWPYRDRDSGEAGPAA